MKRLNHLATALLLSAAAAQAQMPPDMAMPKPGPKPAARSSALTDGIVRNVDPPGGRVTLQHGEIANMGMPPMTMAFSVREKKMLDRLKAGDKVRFHLENVDGAPTVTRIERAQ